MSDETKTGGFVGDPFEAFTPVATGGCCGSAPAGTNDAVGGCCGTVEAAAEVGACCAPVAKAEAVAAGSGCCG